jgi:hypothetical protein
MCLFYSDKGVVTCSVDINVGGVKYLLYFGLFGHNMKRAVKNEFLIRLCEGIIGKFSLQSPTVSETLEIRW